MEYPLLHCIDLHTHSDVSDGTDTPSQIVRQAAELGLTAVALTDHDTVEGIPEAMESGAKLGQEVVPGCEVSAGIHYGGEIYKMHIVALWPDIHHPALVALLGRQKSIRKARNEEIFDNLIKLGINIDLSVFGKDIADLGKPHFAAALVTAGVVSSPDDAFSMYLNRGGKAYVPVNRMTPLEMLPELKQAGATTIIAHPLADTPPFSLFEKAIADFADKGILDGLEAFHPKHNKVNTAKILELASRYNLLVSGGSDYHGERKPGIRLGYGGGNLRIPEVYFFELKKRRLQEGLPC